MKGIRVGIYVQLDHLHGLDIDSTHASVNISHAARILVPLALKEESTKRNIAERASVRNCIFLGVDAVHFHPPKSRIVMNTSMQDAYSLVWKIAYVLKGHDPALLQTYAEERLPIAKRLIEIATMFYDIYS